MTPEDEARLQHLKLISETSKCLQAWIERLHPSTFTMLSDSSWKAIETLCKIEAALLCHKGE